MKTMRYRGYASGDAAAPTAPMIETYSPSRAPDIRADFLTPAAQALFSGFVGGLAGALGAWRVWDGDVLTWACGGFVVALGVSWVISLGLVRDLLWTVERISQRDLDGDGAQGKPDDPGHLVALQPMAARSEVAREARQTAEHTRLLWLVGFVQRCYAVGTSESAQGIKPGERSKYLEARDLLLTLGLAAWRDPESKRLGWNMTTEQAHAIKVLREHVKTIG